ncbi:hypothetical protein ABZ930_29390 [Streptomyces sp. NPDC046716]
MTNEEFGRLMKQARAEVRRTALPRRDVSPREVYEARARHAEFGACSH